MKIVGRRLFRLARSERGGAMAELAVVLPLLVLFSIGVMDYGRVFFRSIMVANAARAGAEWAALNTANSGKLTDAQDFAKLDGQEISGLKVTSARVCRCGDVVVDCSGTCAGYGNGAPRLYVQITALDSVNMLFNYPGLPAKIAISRTATFRAPQ
jgi:Flp pilus assembly protein TadG